MKKEEVNKQIKEVVRPNGKGEINGNNLQETLLLMNNNAANDEDTTSKLNLKANQKETDEKLALKADKTSVYTKEEANALLDLKVNIKDYEADKEVSNKEKQELDIKLTQTKQELDSVKNSLSHMGNGVVGEAKGGSVINLPNNSMKSVVPNYKIEGLTVQNLVKNGDTPFNLVDTAVGNMVRFKASIDDLIYYRVRAFVVEDVNMNFCGTNIYNINKSKKNDTIASAILTIEDNSNPIIGLWGSRGSTIIKQRMYLNLTQMFGAGNEPSKEWCDANLPDYVEGTKSVQLPMRVKSVGENLFDPNILIKFGFIDAGDFYYKQSPQDTQNLNYFTLLSGITYYLKYSFIGENESNWRFVAVPRNSDEEPLNLFPDKGIHKIDGSQYSHISATYGFGGELKIKNIYLSKSENELYKPYQESLAYFNDEVELKSVGEVSDYIENGKLYKNIKRHYFSKEDKWTLREEYTEDNFRYQMNLPFDYKATGSGVEGELFCNNFTPTSNVEGFLNKRDSNTIALYRENASALYLTLDKKVDNVNDAIPEGTFVDVILPQTEVTNLNKSGLIEANPNGTVFFEPITNITGFYDNGLDVEGLNILEVEEFSHLINGVYQSLDVSKVKIEGGKLTHPDAQSGIVYLVYRYDDNAVWGENTISYYNSDKTLKSPNGKIWKKVETATDTGELVVTLEEVNIVEPLKEEE